ncbi:hypothetical protein EDB84DRAFT_1636886 [Lactarius hengduanensis]|nr:hypothetical protein EDB84DRAFT_1636886 [Lactarius hengduanensis]
MSTCRPILSRKDYALSLLPFAHSSLRLRPASTERRTSSGRLDFPSSPSPTPILDDMLQTESHSPIQWLSSAPDLGATTEGDGSAEVSLHKEKDAIYPLLLIRENTMFTPELPSQSPSPQSVNDVAIAGPSRRSLDAEHTGDLPHPSRGQYDIVQ